MTKKIVIHDNLQITITKNLTPKTTILTFGKGTFQTTNNPRYLEISMIGAGGSGSGLSHLGRSGEKTLFGNFEVSGGEAGKHFQSSGESGKFMSFKISNPQSSYSYLVGKSSGPYAGGDGVVKITEYY